VAGDEPADGPTDGEGSRADAMENRSGVVDRVRPLPIRGSCRRQPDAAMVQRRNGKAPTAIGPVLELAWAPRCWFAPNLADTVSRILKMPRAAHDSRRYY
jgi:hypothetical protein